MPWSPIFGFLFEGGQFFGSFQGRPECWLFSEGSGVRLFIIMDRIYEQLHCYSHHHPQHHLHFGFSERGHYFDFFGGKPGCWFYRGEPFFSFLFRGELGCWLFSGVGPGGLTLGQDAGLILQFC